MMSGPQLTRSQSTGLSRLGVLSQAAIEAKLSSRVQRCTSFDLVCATRESHGHRCERLPQATVGMCQLTVDIFNIHCVPEKVIPFKIFQQHV